MSSAKKISANRRNGRLSRGPKTSTGQARSCRNSLRHGLTRISRHNPFFAAEIKQLASVICGEDRDPLLYEQAMAIAESELIIACVRTQMVTVVDRLWDSTAFPYSMGLEGLDIGFEMLKGRIRCTDKIVKYYEPSAEQKSCDGDKPESIDSLLAARWSPENREESEAMLAALPDILPLERYLRRAWSQRRRALRSFIELRNRRHSGP
jgi:hypothetical protein